MKKKQLVAILMTMMACLSALVASATAADSVPPAPSNSSQAIVITPFWVNVNQVSATLDFNGKTAICESTITGQSGTTKITGTLTLYRQNGSSWEYVDSWSKSADSSVLRFSEEKTVTSGNTYKIEISTSVYRNGTWETVQKESSAKYCG